MKWFPSKRYPALAFSACCAIAMLLVGITTARVAFAQHTAAKAITVVLATAFESPNDIIMAVLPQELGYFADEGLAPQFEWTPSSGQVIQLLTARRADIGFGSAVQVAAARSSGVPIKAIYNILRDSATALAVPADSPITKPQELKGKTIGIVAIGSARALDGRAMARAAGLDPDSDVKWLPVGTGAEALQALRSNQVQALCLWDAAYADMENQGERFRYFRFPFQRDLFSSVWEASETYVDDNQNVIIGFGRAEAKATIFATTNPRAAVDIYLKAHPELIPAGESREKAFSDALNILQSNIQNMKLQGGVAEYGSFTVANWQKVQQYYHQLGLIKTPIRDVSSYFLSASIFRKMNDFDHAAIVAKAKAYRP